MLETIQIFVNKQNKQCCIHTNDLHQPLITSANADTSIVDKSFAFSTLNDL